MMKLTKTKLLASLILAILFSITCADMGTANNPPTLTVMDQTFTVSENANVGDAIATVEVASKVENKPLTYSITTNDNNLFEIDADSGVLRLADGQYLDYEVETSHSIMVKVTDGELSRTATITLMVGNEGGYCGDGTTTTPVALYNKVDGMPLRLDPLIASGDGTEANPYVVPIERGCADFTFIYDPSPTGQDGGLIVPVPSNVYFSFDLAPGGYQSYIHNTERLLTTEGFNTPDGLSTSWGLNLGINAYSFIRAHDAIIDKGSAYRFNNKTILYFFSRDSRDGSNTFITQKGWRLERVNCADTGVTCLTPTQ